MDTAQRHAKYYRRTIHYLIIYFAPQNFIFEDLILIKNQLLISYVGVELKE